MGAIAGVVGAIIGGLLTFLLELIGVPGTQEAMQGFFEGFMSPEQLEQMEAQQEASRGPAGMLLGILIGAVFGAIFGAVGGAIGGGGVQERRRRAHNDRPDSRNHLVYGGRRGQQPAPATDVGRGYGAFRAQHSAPPRPAPIGGSRNWRSKPARLLPEEATGAKGFCNT